jgi:hypothetical protein
MDVILFLSDNRIIPHSFGRNRPIVINTEPLLKKVRSVAIDSLRLLVRLTQEIFLHVCQELNVLDALGDMVSIKPASTVIDQSIPNDCFPGKCHHMYNLKTANRFQSAVRQNFPRLFATHSPYRRPYRISPIAHYRTSRTVHERILGSGEIRARYAWRHALAL